MFKKLAEIEKIAKTKKTQRIVVAAAGDQDVLEAIKNAQEFGIIVPVFVGDLEKIKEIASKINLDLSNIEMYDYPDKFEASEKAVQLIREGKGWKPARNGRRLPIGSIRKKGRISF